MSEESTSEKVTITMSQFERLEREMARCRLAMMPLLNKAGVELTIVDDPPAMTQEAVESWILLKGQDPKAQWFEIVITDPEVGDDPTAKALMKVVSDMILKGIHDMPFIEAQQKDRKDKPDLKIIESGRDVKGEPH